MEDSIVAILEAKHLKSGGHCGIYLHSFPKDWDREIMKNKLNKLYKEKKITIHDGIHGKLIKLNRKYESKNHQ